MPGHPVLESINAREDNPCASVSRTLFDTLRVCSSEAESTAAVQGLPCAVA
jgi:hypothetical protein